MIYSSFGTTVIMIIRHTGGCFFYHLVVIDDQFSFAVFTGCILSLCLKFGLLIIFDSAVFLMHYSLEHSVDGIDYLSAASEVAGKVNLHLGRYR